MCKKCLNLEFQHHLQDLVTAAKHHPAGSLERNKQLTKVIRQIYPLIKRDHNPDDADVVQNILFFLVKNLDNFDPGRGCLLTWLGSRLFFGRRDLDLAKINQQRHETRLDAALVDDENGWLKGVPEVPSRNYGSLEMLDRVHAWVQTDPKGILRQTHLENHPEINAQVLILLRLPLPETPWKEIAAKFGKPISTLNAFYQRKCIPLLREFGSAEDLL
jgi:hypothetical protein